MKRLAAELEKAQKGLAAAGGTEAELRSQVSSAEAALQDRSASLEQT